MVRLCRISFNGTDLVINSYGYLQISTADASKIYTRPTSVTPALYNPKTDVVSMEDHVMCMGSGIPSPTNPHGLTPKDIGVEDKNVSQHEIEMHTPGLMAKSSSLSSAFYIALNSVSIVDTPDNLVLFNLTESERLHYNGTWISSYAYKDQESETGRVYLHFREGTVGNYYAVPDGAYALGLDLSTRKLVVGSETGATHQMQVCADSLGDEVIETITILSDTSFEEGIENGTYYPLAVVTFSGTKKQSSIVSSFATENGVSNFVNKEDMRLFGSLDPAEIQNTREFIAGSWKSVVDLPYELKVKALNIDGTRFTGETFLPSGYIRGFKIDYANNRAITVSPGCCKDKDGVTDIVLSHTMTKYVDRQWVSGGTSGIVGGLQNDFSTSCVLDSDDAGTALHVFVCSTESGIVDIVLDNDIDGKHINSREDLPTASFVHIRRIATIYISHLFADSNAAQQEILRQFYSIVDGNGLYIQYYNAPVLDAATYSSADQTFIYTYVPSGVMVRGKFAYNMAQQTITVFVNNPDYDPDTSGSQQYIPYSLQQAASGSLFIPSAVATDLPIYGTGIVDLYMNNGRLKSNGAWDFNNQIKCLGYYDSRDID